MRNTGDVNHSYGGKEFADLDWRIRHLTTVAQKTKYIEEYTDIIEPTFLRAALTTARHWLFVVMVDRGEGEEGEGGRGMNKHSKWCVFYQKTIKKKANKTPMSKWINAMEKTPKNKEKKNL